MNIYKLITEAQLKDSENGTDKVYDLSNFKESGISYNDNSDPVNQIMSKVTNFDKTVTFDSRRLKQRIYIKNGVEDLSSKKNDLIREFRNNGIPVSDIEIGKFKEYHSSEQDIYLIYDNYTDQIRSRLEIYPSFKKEFPDEKAIQDEAKRIANIYNEPDKI